jgi:hypothetical protein
MYHYPSNAKREFRAEVYVRRNGQFVKLPSKKKHSKSWYELLFWVIVLVAVLAVLK